MVGEIGLLGYWVIGIVRSEVQSPLSTIAAKSKKSGELEIWRNRRTREGHEVEALPPVRSSWIVRRGPPYGIQPRLGGYSTMYLRYLVGTYPESLCKRSTPYSVFRMETTNDNTFQ